MNTDKNTFHDLGISPTVIALLDGLKLTEPTPIQRQAIPSGIEGKDIVGIAQTGTGKTLAFGIPMIERLSKGGGKGLILVPTRELALQVDESIRKLGTPLGIRTAILIGGVSMRPQLSSLDRNPHIVIATPGRLIDHLEQGTIRLTKVEVLVLDEADRMLDMGFWPQIRKIISLVPVERQTMLFSATLSREIMDLAHSQMRIPLRIEVAPQGTTAENVTQEFFILRKEEKVRLLEKILSERTGSTLVFTRTKHGAEKLVKLVSAMGHSAAEIHGNRSLNQRTQALNNFKTGRVRVLVATDIASRGIDVKGIDLVVNFDMPMQTADYVHRIGRTARAGASGHAITFAMPDERRDMRDIERLIRKQIVVTPLPNDLPPARAPLPGSSSSSDYARPQRSFHPRPQGTRAGFASRNSRAPRRRY